MVSTIPRCSQSLCVCETYENDLEQHLLVDLHELLVPLIDVRCLLARVGIVVSGSGGVTLVVLAPLDHLAEDGLVDLRMRMLADVSQDDWE